jgi:hypothetical protein
VEGETDSTNRLLNLSVRNGNCDYIIQDQETETNQKLVDTVKIANYSIMDQAQPAMIKNSDYVVGQFSLNLFIYRYFIIYLFYISLFLF